MRKKIADFYNKYSVAFNIISFLVAIGSICLTIWISKQPVTLPQKELSCITTNSKSLVLMLGNDSNLKLLYGEREVSKPCITSIVIQNTGAYPITNSDFLRPFIIAFGETDEILSVNIGDCSNQYIREQVVENSSFSNQKLTIDNFLLNPGEMFTVDIISDGGIPLINFDYRLEGISELNLINNPSNQIILTHKENPVSILPFLVLLCLIVVAVIIVMVIVMKKLNKRDAAMFDRLETAIRKEMQEENQHEQSD